MGDALVTCPVCERAPGRPHGDYCPQSRRSQRRLSQTCLALGQGRLVWTKGYMRIAGRIVENPGLPLVKGKVWSAGGVPRRGNVRPMLKAIAAAKEKIRAESPSH